jgi:hypothetical protein
MATIHAHGMIISVKVIFLNSWQLNVTFMLIVSWLSFMIFVQLSHEVKTWFITIIYMVYIYICIGVHLVTNIQL